MSDPILPNSHACQTARDVVQWAQELRPHEPNVLMSNAPMADDNTTDHGNGSSQSQSNRVTIKISEELHRKHQARKGDLTWEEYIDGQQPSIYENIEAVMRDIVEESDASGDTGRDQDGETQARPDVLNENALREIVREETTRAIRDNLQTR